MCVCVLATAATSLETAMVEFELTSTKAGAVFIPYAGLITHHAFMEISIKLLY